MSVHSSKYRKAAEDFLIESVRHQYSYNFTWLSRPVIQYPQDIVSVQQLIWDVKPDLIIELGVAHGGSLVLSASMLALLDLCEFGQVSLEGTGEHSRKVLGVDIEIREHNRMALEEHPLWPRIDLIQGSSIDAETTSQVWSFATNYEKILLFVDSNHSHKHVLEELRAYAPLVGAGSYCVVFDTVIENLPADTNGDRPWGPGDNPMTAMHEYLKELEDNDVLSRDGKKLNFEIDRKFEAPSMLTVAPDGFLRRI